VGHAVALWLRRYATNRKVAGSIHDEVNFLISLILPFALGPAVYSASNRNEYKMFLGSKVRRVSKADCLDNDGSLTSHNPIGLQGLLRG
jgi:hypothetical protein